MPPTPFCTHPAPKSLYKGESLSKITIDFENIKWGSAVYAILDINSLIMTVDEDSDLLRVHTKEFFAELEKSKIDNTIEENNNLAEGNDVSRAISLKRIYFPTAWCYLFIILRGACVFKARRKSKVFFTCLMDEVFAFFRKREKNKQMSRQDKGLVHQKEKKEFTTERKRTTLL